ncbi:helix-turn-helix domain-containing protein [Providencia sp. wls1943]|uniref:helix-turn-helix domain-containing protein n=1 Tax=Providencia sp. wls1943 TaxID=2675150 RepID=UPI001E547E4A|nr:helix-turn-helix transcriptional regulator [Providencia sp. wls1943]
MMTSTTKATLAISPENYFCHPPEKRITAKQLNEATGLFIRQKRIELGLNGSDLGRLLNVSQQQISRYERGITSLTLHQLEQFLRALAVSWESFIREVIHPLCLISQDGQGKLVTEYPFL